MLLLVTFFHFHFSTALQFRLDSNSILQVASSNGTFSPLCIASVRDEFVKTACSRDSTAPTPSTEPTPLNPLGSALSVACTEARCFTFPSPYCTQGVRLTCDISLPDDEDIPNCPKGSFYLAGRCITVISTMFSSFSEAKEACPIRVVSLPTESDRLALSQLLLQQFDPTIPYYTSGFRQGSKWIWEDGTTIEPPPAGTGRCLSLKGELWIGVDCEAPGAVICEQGPECVFGKSYQGTHNTTTSGQPCLRWSDPSVLFYGHSVEEQSSWNHNFCRVLNGSLSCFMSPNQLAVCSLPQCQLSQMRDVQLVRSGKCMSEEFQCQDGNCIASEFRCDYEKDCQDGSDERGCEDFLASFELIGALKLTDKIIEVWTNVPHVQGCAKRCKESVILCEAFSFEPKSHLCLLSDSSSYSIVTPRPTSLYYKRRYSPRDVEFSLRGTALMAGRNGTVLAICGDNLSQSHASAVCSVAGFGVAIPNTSQHKILEQGWSVDCLRYSNCENPTACSPLQCSNCSQAVCDDGTCISNAQICNNILDCKSGSDEENCLGAEFRLSSGSEASGNIEVLVGDQWLPVCAESVNVTVAESVCSILKLGSSAVLLTSNQITVPGRNIRCTSGTCSLGDQIACGSQARVRCNSILPDSAAKCGVRKVEVQARDAISVRLARVVGGFETAAGAFPWTAAIKTKTTGVHHCGATILDETHLITAAHCFEDDRRPSSYVIVAGDWENNRTEGTEQFFVPIRLYFYPLYENLFAHDLAIIEIPSPGFQWSDYVQPICLPDRHFSYESGTKCVVSGWGSMGFAVLPIIDRNSCISASKIYQSMSRTAFCAGYLEGGIDSCQGDSGGPYSCRIADGSFVLAGVISWGDGCAQKNQPGIYTMVAPYLTWIEDTINTKRK